MWIYFGIPVNAMIISVLSLIHVSYHWYFWLAERNFCLASALGANIEYSYEYIGTFHDVCGIKIVLHCRIYFL